MKSYLLIEKKGCYYLVSLRHKMVLNISKILFNLININEINKNQNNIFYLTQKKIPEKILIKEFQNQLKKYNILKENRFFEPFPLPLFQCEVLPHQIKAKSIKNDVQLVFESTFLCNLSCTYCCYGKYYTLPARKNKKMDFEIAKKAIDYVINWRKEQSNLFSIGFYGGEALLSIEFIQSVVNYCESIKAQNDISFLYDITTNGVLLDKYFEYLVENNFKIAISLDGNQFNNSFRVFENLNESYPIVFKNISLIREKYPDFYKKNVSFQTVRHKRNRGFNLDKYFEETFQKKTLISDVRFEDLKSSNKDDFYKIIADNTTSFTNNPLYKIRKFFDFFYSTPFFWVENESVNIKRPSDTCLPFQAKVFITTDGEILPCEQIGSEYNFGIIDESGVHLDFEKLAKKYTKYFKKLVKSCSTCYKHSYCSECVFKTGINNPKYSKCTEYIGIYNLKKIFTKIIH